MEEILNPFETLFSFFQKKIKAVEHFGLPQKTNTRPSVYSNQMTLKLGKGTLGKKVNTQLYFLLINIM